MLADPLTKAMDADKLLQFLDCNEWDLEQPVESILKKRAKRLGKRKMFETYEDVNMEKLTKFQDIPASAPCTWDNVVRRCTSDLITGDVIDDDHKITTRTEEFKFRELPRAPRKIRTVWYYKPEADPEDQENVDPEEDYSFLSLGRLD